MIRRRALQTATLGAVLVAAAALAWLGARPPDLPWPDPPSLRLEPGAARGYVFEIRSQGWLGGDAPGARRGFTLQADGVLVLRPQGADGAQPEVRARLSGARLTLDGRAPPWAAALEAPFSFRVDRHGRFGAIDFPAGVPGETAVFLEQLVGRLQVVLPRERRPAWRTRERDAAGIFRAEYRVDPATPLRVEKRRLEYLPSEAGDPPPQVVESRSRIELEPGLTGVRRVEGAEVLRRRAGTFEGGESVSFRYVRADPPADASLERLSGEARAPEQARRPADPLPAPPRPPDLPDARAVTEILRRFGEAFGRDPAAADALLTAWLRQPGAPATLVGQLDAMALDLERAQLDAARRAALWRLLAQTGTPEAEAALLSAALDPAHPPLSRRQALGHFGQVTTARPEMVRGLLGLHASEREQRGDPQLAAMALLAVGALGHPDLAGPEVSRSVREALDRQLARAETPEERAGVLAAMGNAGEPCLPAVRAALSDPVPSVRAAAVDALRRVEEPTGRRVLLAHAAVEPDPMVRARTVDLLQRLGPDREVLAWAAAATARESDRMVLRSLVELLGGSSRRSPEARAALEALRGTEDRELRKRVLRYVPPARRE